MKKRIFALVLAVAMVLSFAACGDKKEETAKSTTFKVGATGPLTGEVAIYGVAVKNGATIAVEEINKKEGTTFFDFNMQDDEHNVEKAGNAFNKLVDWGMQFMLGSVTSAPATETAAKAFEEGYFYLTPSASDPQVTKDKTGIFQMCFTDPNQGAGAATFMANTKMGEKYFVIYQKDSDYSTGIYKKFMDQSSKEGLNIVGEATFNSGNKDFSTQVKAARDAGADVVFLPMYYQEASLILMQAKQLEYAPQWFGVDGMDGILTLDGFDATLAEGVGLLTPFDATASNTQNFVNAYKKAYGETPNQFAADAYDCVYAVYDAIKASGATPDMSAKDLGALLTKTFTSSSFKFTGLTGSDMTWTTAGEVSKAPNAVKIENGVYVTF